MDSKKAMKIRRKLRQLSWAERKTLAQTFLLLPLNTLVLRVFGFTRWQSFLSRLSPLDDKATTESSEQMLSEARLTAWMVRAAAWRIPVHANCLHQSLTLWWLLRRRGIAGDLRIGVRKNGDGCDAHAWVEYLGQVLNDSDDVHQRFAPFAKAIIPAEAKLQ